MLHLRYYRVERERWDHVVLLLPDTGAIPNFLPTADDYQKLVQEILPEQLKQKISQIEAEPFAPQSDAAKKVQAAMDNENNETSADDEKPAEQIVEDASTAPAEQAIEGAAPAADSTTDSLNQSTDANNEVQYTIFKEFFSCNLFVGLWVLVVVTGHAIGPCHHALYTSNCLSMLCSHLTLLLHLIFCFLSNLFS